MCKSKGIKNISKKKRNEKAAKPAKQEDEGQNEMTLKGFDAEPGFK